MEELEETRKIQFTGKSSYIVSLPKQWITELGLKKGDQIRMVRQGSSSLQIYPPKFHAKISQKEDATIEIDNEEEPKSIIRKLISLYFCRSIELERFASPRRTACLRCSYGLSP